MAICKVKGTSDPLTISQLSIKSSMDTLIFKYVPMFSYLVVKLGIWIST
ncbi:hypothetical protein LPICM02_50014 [Pseudolactococcus piscium]|nr:hypothetical protein LPICM02_50014 [Lactococcus piscium]